MRTITFDLDILLPMLVELSDREPALKTRLEDVTPEDTPEDIVGLAYCFFSQEQMESAIVDPRQLVQSIIDADEVEAMAVWDEGTERQ